MMNTKRSKISQKDRLLIAVDLDGTLLSDQKRIKPRTKRALQLAMEQGHIVVIATGRPFRASKQYYDELHLTTPMINFNGALVHNPRQQDWGLFHKPLDFQTARNVIMTSEHFGVKNVMLEVLDEVFVRNHHEVTIQTFFEEGTDIQQLPKLIHRDPTSILIHPYEQNVHDLRQRLADNHAEVIEHRKWGAPWHVIEIVRSGLNKAVGLQRISQYFNIPVQNMIAFGDEDNDFEMIEYVGTGVAMGNAIPELKERADTIALTNEEEGIALYLEQHVL